MHKLGKQVTKLRTQFEMLAEKMTKEALKDTGDNHQEAKRKSFFDVQLLSKQVRKRG